MASHLHLHDAVSPTAAPRGLSVTAGDAQIFLAPDSGSSPDADAFGQQLQDLSANALLPGAPSTPQLLSNNNSGTRLPNTNKGDWNHFLLPIVPAPAINQIVHPIQLAVAATVPVEPVTAAVLSQPETAAVSESTPVDPGKSAAGPVSNSDGTRPLLGPQIEPARAAILQAATPGPNASIPSGNIAPNRILTVSGVRTAATTQPVARPTASSIAEQLPVPNPGSNQQPTVSADTVSQQADVSTAMISPTAVPAPAADMITHLPIEDAPATQRDTPPAQSPISNSARQAPVEVPNAVIPSAVTSVTISVVQSPAKTETAPQPASPLWNLPVQVQASATDSAASVPVGPIQAVTETLPWLSDKTPISRMSGTARTESQRETNQRATNPAQSMLVRPVPILPNATTAPSGAPLPSTQGALQTAPHTPPPAQAVTQEPLQAQADAAPQTMTTTPTTQPAGGELSFAVKVTPQDNALPASDAEAAVKSQDIPSGVPLAPIRDMRHEETGGGSADTAVPREAAHVATLAGPPIVSAEKQPVSQPPTPEAPPTPQPAAIPVETTSIGETAEAKAPQPLKQLSIQVGQTPQQKVEVQVVQRAGELQVAVRSANPELAQGLRQGVTELVGQLQQNGFHADAWRPVTPAGSAPLTAEKPQTQAGSQNNNSQPQSGGQQGRQQGNQNQSPRPQWVEELETTFAGNQEGFPGETYGISR